MRAVIFVRIAAVICTAMLTEPCIPSPEKLPTGIVNGDFDGDGVVDKAELFQYETRVVVSIQRGGSHAGSQQLEFGVNPSRQDAICELPAKLEAEPLNCSTDESDEQLPGCKVMPNGTGLRLNGGDCDSIHLYWNHDAGKMTWWRL